MLVLLLGAAGCTDAPLGAAPHDGAGGRGKADGFDTESLPALEAVSLRNLIECFGLTDESTTDPSMQRHEVRCAPQVMPAGIWVSTIFVQVSSADSSLYQTEVLNPVDFGMRDAVVSVRNEHFPIRLRVSVAFRLGDNGTENWGFERTIEAPSILESLTAELPITIGLPFELWPVALYPTDALADAWSTETVTWLRMATDYSFFIPRSAELAAGGSYPVAEITDRREIAYERDELASLTSLVRTPTYYPMPIEGLDEPAALSIGTSAAGTINQLAGPGYYLVNSDGVATLTAREDLPGIGMGAVTPDGGLEVDDGTAADGGMGGDGGAMDAGAGE